MYRCPEPYIEGVCELSQLFASRPLLLDIRADRVTGRANSTPSITARAADRLPPL